MKLYLSGHLSRLRRVWSTGASNTANATIADSWDSLRHTTQTLFLSAALANLDLLTAFDDNDASTLLLGPCPSQMPWDPIRTSCFGGQARQRINLWNFVRPLLTPRYGSDQEEERRLLGYKNPVRTSQETHYVSATESSRLMLCKIWGFHGGDYEECRLLGYENPVRTWQETHYFSATDSSQLMLCKIWGFHGGHYEECRLLGYKNPVRTSQETHYVSATELSRLMLCKIWGFHGGDYEECRLLGYKNLVRTSQETHYVSAVLSITKYQH
jgi:hypothetical protein